MVSEIVEKLLEKSVLELFVKAVSRVATLPGPTRNASWVRANNVDTLFSKASNIKSTVSKSSVVN